jgi:hypothetical protein
VPVSPDTKGLVWLSEKNADDLMAILRQYPTIEWVQLPWAGVDAFATVLAYLATQPEDQRPVVTSAKGAYSEPVAEHALALMLACMRELPSKARDAFWQPERTGLSVFGRHIVLVGAGGVGRAFLDVVRPFRPTITVVRRQNVPVAGADNTITPEVLPQVYDRLFAACGRYLLVAEYYNPAPVAIPYRGHSDRLFKRDFAGEIMDRHPRLQLVDYGFAYHRDPNFPQDDITWFLLEKR